MDRVVHFHGDCGYGGAVKCELTRHTEDSLGPWCGRTRWCDRDDRQRSEQSGDRHHDCVFAGDTLVLVGQAWGDQDEILKGRDRLAVIEHDVVTKATKWIVAGPGPGVQSRALALAIDGDRYHLAGYKTVVAMHRARFLAKNVFKEPGQRVLFTTFTANLAADIRTNLKRMCGPEIDRIEVKHLQKVARDVLASKRWLHARRPCRSRPASEPRPAQARLEDPRRVPPRARPHGA